MNVRELPEEWAPAPADGVDPWIDRAFAPVFWALCALGAALVAVLLVGALR